jgi:hypothetical protein
VVAVLLAVCGVVLVAMVGLVADLGRAYIARNELAAFTDAAAVAAAYELDGTSSGITAAESAGTNGPGSNLWNFGTTAVSGIQVRFATTPAGAYSPAGSAPLNSRFVRITVNSAIALYFLPIIPGVSTSMPVTVSAVAGQGLLDSPGRGGDPFSPDAIDPSDTANFGFTLGEQYDLKWAPPGQRNKPGGKCSGDIAAGQDAAGGAADRGYIDLGQGNGNSALHAAIVNNDFGAHPVELHVGEAIDTVTGNKNVGPALTTRIAQDSDTASASYSTYTGNGRRILVLPVNDHTAAGLVVGFGAFFLPLGIPCLADNNKACCGEYIGPALVGGKRKAAGAPGKVYAVRLFQ